MDTSASQRPAASTGQFPDQPAGQKSAQITPEVGKTRPVQQTSSGPAYPTVNFQHQHHKTSPPVSPPRSGSSTPFGGRYPRGSGYYSPPVSPGGRSTASGKEGCFSHVRMTSFAKVSRYFCRLRHFRHMDFEFACWQMIYLLVAPQKVYRNFMYRKRTKDQWARDDPAFLVLLSAALAISSIGFAFVLGLSFGGFIKFLLWVICIDCIAVGVVIATLLWLLANNFLRRVRDQDVEWGFCFDVHLNAFFPLLVMLHVVVPLFYAAVIKHPWFLSRFFGNTIWFLAITYYIYITFLGYTALPILKNTHIFLYPFTFLFIFYVATVTVGWNISNSVMAFYHFRVT